MSINIILIGGLRDGTSHSDLLNRLRQKNPVADPADWQWVFASAPHWQPNHKEMNRFLDQLRKWLSAKAKNAPDLPDLHVVKLVDLHGRAASDLFRTWKEPKLVPDHIVAADELVRWLFSPETGLIPPSKWFAGPTGAALIAILSKLLTKKRWAGSVAGHDFLKECDLLTQSPVDRPGHPKVTIEAKRMLDSLADGLLFTKGGSKTPKEWAINKEYLPQIKRAFIQCSFMPLKTVPGLDGLIDRIAQEANTIELRGEIVTERVLYEAAKK